MSLGPGCAIQAEGARFRAEMREFRPRCASSGWECTILSLGCAISGPGYAIQAEGARPLAEVREFRPRCAISGWECTIPGPGCASSSRSARFLVGSARFLAWDARISRLMHDLWPGVREFGMEMREFQPECAISRIDARVQARAARSSENRLQGRL